MERFSEMGGLVTLLRSCNGDFWGWLRVIVGGNPHGCYVTRVTGWVGYVLRGFGKMSKPETCRRGV